MSALLEDDYRFISEAGDKQSPCLYLIDMHDHPIQLADVAKRANMNIFSVFVSDWNNDLTPWPAPGLYKDDPCFKGNASMVLQKLTHELIPAIEAHHELAPSARAIGGYSLGGLFSAYAFIACRYFDAAASMSGSLWYEGWPAFAQRECAAGAAEGRYEGRFIYFSIGSQERKSPPKTLATVEERNRQTSELLAASGAESEFHVGPGNHFQHISERIEKGVCAVDAFFRHKR